jgi:two-component system KDP operon response regulator KdpE
MKKILVAEQEEVLCMLYAEELIEEGYELVTISRISNDLMAMVEAESPDLVVLDMGMHEQDNGRFLRDRHSKSKNVPVILCTTYPLSKLTPHPWDMDEIVLKRSDLGELKAKINTIIEGPESSRALSLQNSLGTFKSDASEQLSFSFREA